MKRIGIKVPGITVKDGKAIPVRKRADICTELKRKANANKPRPVSRAKAQQHQVLTRSTPRQE